MNSPTVIVSVHLLTGCKNRQSVECYLDPLVPSARWTSARNACLNENADLAIFPTGMKNEVKHFLQNEYWYAIGLIRQMWYWGTDDAGKTSIQQLPRSPRSMKGEFLQFSIGCIGLIT